MNTPEEIKQWLVHAFTDRAGSLNETYYYDARDSEFFSIFITDYFLLEEEDILVTESPYNSDQLNLLKDRITRNDNKDISIIWIPRLTVNERKEMMICFLESHKYLANYDALQKVLDQTDARSEFNFGQLLSEEFDNEWKARAYRFVSEKIEAFLLLHQIDISKSTLWTEEKMTSVTMNLNDKKKKD